MKRKILDFMLTACCMAFSFLGLVACDNELDIRQEYPFTVETMPVADEITDGETVEIRLEIKPEGNFAGTVYTLRYFQPDGKGSLKMEDGTVLKPNDRGAETHCCYGFSQSIPEMNLSIHPKRK